MATIDIGRIKFVWKGTYNPATIYIRDDVIYYNGSAYVCVINLQEQISGISPSLGNPVWNLMVQGYVPGQTIICLQNITRLLDYDFTQIVNGTIFFISGYYLDNDRGGGVFKWNTSSTDTHDGGLWLKPTLLTSLQPGRYQRILDGERPNVKMWGAYGDNTHIDSTFIQNAINATQNYWSSELVFTAGQYLINTSILLPCDTKIIGEPYSNIIMQSGINSNIIVTTNAKNTSNKSLNIENISLFYQDTSTTGTSLLIQQSVDKINLTNLSFYNGNYGIYISPTVNKYNNIHISNLYTNNIGTAIYLNNELCNLTLENFALSGNMNSVIYYNSPNIDINAIPNITLENGIILGTTQQFDLVTINSTINSNTIPLININSLTLNSNCRYIINDLYSNYNIYNQSLNGRQQLNNFSYHVEQAALSSQRDRLITNKKIDVATTQFIPLNTGWYTIYTGISGACNANLNITSAYESTNFDVMFNSSQSAGFIKCNSFDTYGDNILTPPCCTNARVLSYNNLVYVDIYVSVPNLPIIICHNLKGRDSVKQDTLCVPTSSVNIPDQTQYVGYEEIQFQKGIVTSSNTYNNAHLKLGSNHYWNNNNQLTHYNDGIDMLIVDGGGTGATAVGYIQNGQVVRVNVTNGGSGYVYTPSVYAAIHDGGGSGATFTASINGGKVTKIITTNGGSGYGTQPSNNSGRNFLTDVGSVLNGGAPIRNVRRIGLQSFNLKTTMSSSVLSGSGLSTQLYPGDVLMDTTSFNSSTPNTARTYEVKYIVDDNTCILTTSFNVGSYSSHNFTKVGWELFPALSGYKYAITGARIWNCASTTNWSPCNSSSSSLFLALKTKPLSAIIAKWDWETIDNNSGDDIGDDSSYESFMMRSGNMRTFIRPIDSTFDILNGQQNIIPPINPETGLRVATGTVLPSNNGIMLGTFWQTNVQYYYLPTTASAALIEVWGMKYPTNSTY